MQGNKETPAVSLRVIYEAAEKMSWKKARGDAVWFLKTFVKTLDEHDEDTPVKRFPVHPVTERIVDRWQNLQEGQHLAVAKSRQLMATWLGLSIVLWELLRKPGRLVGVVSKKENDAMKLLGETRMGMIYNNLPHWLKARYPIEPTKTMVTIRHPIPEPPSIVLAMPQGAHQARMHTFSMLFFDEAAFQDCLDDAIIGAKPTLHGGGKLLLVSSAAPGAFQDIWEGRWGE
jgi:hypothetical protein